MAARWRNREGGISFSLRLTPKGGRDAIDGWTTGGDGNFYLKARVAVPAQEGKANEALIALLAKTLAVPKSAVHIMSGETAKLKTIAILPAAPSLAGRLEQLGEAS